jgi:dihydroflavonol-4-reductase
MSVVLVTGGTGFVGSHVARRLCEEGFPVRVLARRSSPLLLVDSLPVEIVRGDLLDPESLRNALAGCEVLFHVAADYRLWARDPQELYRNNVEGTENILSAAKAAGVKHIVYTSTIGTVGFRADGTPATETDFPDHAALVGAYKTSKFQAEQRALRYASDGLPVVIVNPSAPVGEGDRKPTDTGKIIVDFVNRRMPAYLDTGLNLVDVRDVAEGHLLALRHGRPGERYILGGRNMDFKEILDALGRITGIPSPGLRIPYGVAWWAGVVNGAISQVTGRPPMVPLDGVRIARHKMFVSSAKAERDLGYKAGPVEAALQRAVTWFREQGMTPREQGMMRSETR